MNFTMPFLNPRPDDRPEKYCSDRRWRVLLWSKQYYHIDVEKWLTTSDGITPVNAGKLAGRNHEWKHLKNQDIIAMPDKWEYPWYAAWDMAFQCIPMAMVDPGFAKNQLLLIMREWYMKPDGQLPAYEWNFSDVNPPVQAWAALQVYRIEKEKTGNCGYQFSKKNISKTADQFYLVDEPERSERK